MTVIFVLVPIATRCVCEILIQARKKLRNEPLTLMESLKAISLQIPIIQPVVHLLYLLRLKAAKDNITRCIKFYKKFNPRMVNEQNRKYFQDDVKNAADDFVKFQKTYQEILTNFQNVRLFEAFGESAPQAAFQIGIVLQLGTLSGLQVFTISTSLFSLSLGASTIFLMMATKNNPIKQIA